MNPEITLVTTTLYENTGVRFNCALKMAREAKRCGYPLVIVDNSPSDDVKRAFRMAGAEVFSGVIPGMGSSRREAVSIALARGADVVVWLEPEKYPLVSLLGPCIEMVASGDYDLVVPRRRSLTGYPFYQHWSELEADWRLGEITGRPDLDLMVGPRVFNRKAAELFLEYTGKPYGDLWQGIFIVILRALASEMSVGSRTVDYVHPLEQTAGEGSEAMSHKRDEQRIVLIEMMAKESARLGYKSPLT